LFDNISKFLAAEYPTDFATWLLGRNIPLTTLSPTELNVDPIRADSVVLMSSPTVALHLEFQTNPDKNMGLRMADYYIRLLQRFPDREINQVVIYLRPTTSDRVMQNEFITAQMTHRFRVIRLWEQPVDAFLAAPGLLPYAVLSQAPNKEEILAQVITQIQQVGDRRQESNLTAAAGILAGLQLNQTIINRLIRSEIMRESVIYQEIYQEGETSGEARGMQRGRSEGRQQEALALVIKLLTRKFGNLSPMLISQVSDRSVEEVESLGEALLDFQSINDLETWLSINLPTS
jgi:predicted transposase/invertase (TIGR01784 family)